MSTKSDIKNAIIKDLIRHIELLKTVYGQDTDICLKLEGLVHQAMCFSHSIN